jgi:hypothetical protein
MDGQFTPVTPSYSEVIIGIRRVTASGSYGFAEVRFLGLLILSVMAAARPAGA